MNFEMNYKKLNKSTSKLQPVAFCSMRNTEQQLQSRFKLFKTSNTPNAFNCGKS